MHFNNWFVAVLCAMVYFCTAEEECINADEDGTCIERCPENTFVYLSGCDNETISQRTCRRPLTKSLGYICDYMRCECNEEKLWDEAAHKCVLEGECADQKKVIEEEEMLKKELESLISTFVEIEFTRINMRHK